MRFTIRDLLWLMVVVGLLALLHSDRSRFRQERQAILKKHDAALENANRMAELKARELAGAARGFESPLRYHAPDRRASAANLPNVCLGKSPPAATEGRWG